MRVVMIVVAVLMALAAWYGFKLEEPCTSKGGHVIQKGNKYVCERDGQIIE